MWLNDIFHRLQATVPIVSIPECQQDYRGVSRVNINEDMVCAGQGRRDSCAGDSGSPLVKVEHPSSGGQPYFKLIGVLHGSKSLCDGRPLGEASMFANLEIFENFYFLQRILGKSCW